ncbi:hypothetical protein [Thalassotalea eurytherma]|uniref:Histidine kinase BarA N-terminal domain-containing protein n=1 Tax=Thalassotalea eurytherma TaxID=1144278 RepID=A0ABQ6GZJ4_9GAMM|nr:hypothetical protein [Thalassotalea eurytherma]GLX81358.1 hypothetical protein theurythT_08100 [Thalassotalea eurytherma]
MKRIELPLYLKLSTIYNKILQLTIVIVLMLVVLNIHFISSQKSAENIHEYYQQVGQLQLQQLSNSAAITLEQGDRKALSRLAEQVSQQAFIRKVTFYDPTGQVIAKSSLANTRDELNTQLTENVDEAQLKATHFIGEIRTTQLLGYVGISLHDEHIKMPLTNSINHLFEQSRLLFILAGIIGVLLARSLSKKRVARVQTNKDQ